MTGASSLTVGLEQRAQALRYGVGNLVQVGVVARSGGHFDPKVVSVISVIPVVGQYMSSDYVVRT